MKKIKLNGKRCLFTEDFLEKPPKGYKYIYYLRHGEDDWCEPVTIENVVVVNRLGRIFCKEPFKMPKSKDKYVNVKSCEWLEERDYGN